MFHFYTPETPEDVWFSVLSGGFTSLPVSKKFLQQNNRADIYMFKVNN